MAYATTLARALARIIAEDHARSAHRAQARTVAAAQPRYGKMTLRELNEQNAGAVSIEVNEGTAVVTDQMLDMWGISVDELHDIAISNTERLSPVEFVSMREMLMDMMLPGDPDAVRDLDMFIPDEAPQMYVLSG